MPVESIAEDLLGLSLVEAELDVSGMLFPAERRIFVNASEPSARERFTIAHELGHWICQCLGGTAAPVMCRAQDVSTSAERALEREANVFAAELIMPEAEVRSEFAGASSAGEVSNRLGVSEDALRWHLFNFGLTEEHPA